MLNCWICKTVISFCSLLFLTSVAGSSKRYSWSSTNEWTICSSLCGNGEEHNIFECVKITSYGTKEYADPEKCSKFIKPSTKRKCLMGPCHTELNSSYIWTASNWTQCPRKCGGQALQNREVSCLQKTQSGRIFPAKLSKCNAKLEPARFISCAKTDCSPTFLASKWGKCPSSKNCGKSVRRRSVKCVSILGNGKHKVISSAFCYKMHQRPLSTWTACIADNDRHCKNMTDIRRISTSVIKIDKDDAEVFQMRSVKRLRLLAGQKAYVFTYTKLSLECPIEGFPRRYMKWIHNGRQYVYEGDSSARVRVNRRGVLVIREFLLTDVGTWRCQAGKSTGNITLNHELPSNGFHSWLKRHSNLNYEMFNEESKGAFIMPDSVMWMKSDWSQCSVSCGSDEDEEHGFQVRKVACEQVDAKYYKIINDKFCPSPKPISKRRCQTTMSCPHWRIEKESNEKCTDQCVDIDTAKMNTNIYCEFETRAVDSSYCESLKPPNITCRNPKCKVHYRYGSWSQCSLSCSNSSRVGIRSRTMHCIWQHDSQPASNLCNHYSIPHKSLSKSCIVPKCILGCRDLSAACHNQSKYRCRSSLFYHFCCAFCRLQNFY